MYKYAVRRLPPIDVFSGFDGDRCLAACGGLHFWKMQYLLKLEILMGETCGRGEGRVSRGFIVEWGGWGSLELVGLSSIEWFLLEVNARKR